MVNAALFRYHPALRSSVIALVAVLLLAVPGAGAGKPPRADAVLAEARAQAEQQHKNIFLIFGASWCSACHDLEAFLDQPQIQPVIAKYFVVVRLTTAEEFGGNPKLNNPGADKLIPKMGGVWGSLPFFAFLDAKGDLIINSRRPMKKKGEDGNIGFPTQPQEIDWFMNMLRRGAPSLSADEARTIEASLQNQ